MPKSNESASDSESDIEIVMDGDPNAPAPAKKETAPTTTKPLVGLPIPRHDSAAVQPAKSGININVIGQHDGIDIIDVDLESFEDKPWRKPGADITDYFNYGFDEQSWRAYCNKQRSMRDAVQKPSSPVDFSPRSPERVYSPDKSTYSRDRSPLPSDFSGSRSRKTSREYRDRSRSRSPRYERERDRDRKPRYSREAPRDRYDDRGGPSRYDRRDRYDRRR